MMKNPEFKVDYFLLLENFAKFETDGQRNYCAVTARAVWPNKNASTLSPNLWPTPVGLLHLHEVHRLDCIILAKLMHPSVHQL